MRLTRVYLARHGRTALNAAGVLRGQIDVPLDDVGQHQALRLAQALSVFSPRRVISSPLLRARQTAQAVAEKIGVEVIVDQRLRDRHYGPWAGMRPEVVARQWGSLDAAPGLEPLEEMDERFLDAVRENANLADGEPVVIIAHDVLNRRLISALSSPPGRPDQVPQEPGCFNIIHFQEKGGRAPAWSVVAVNQIPPEVDVGTPK